MRRKDKYTYPAVFTYYTDGNIGIIFPDLPGCVSSAHDSEEAMYMASDALGLHMAGLEEDCEPLPDPSDFPAIIAKLEPNQTVVPISALMPAYRQAIDSRQVTKMCTIPAWLDNEAKFHRLNFSQTLQEALMQKLGISKTITRKKRRL
ncbi:MAG: type II toxin-antitoxin system HicB family antitoxin [Synergistaceae bacterium]|nr:type II toxin-antitoxin system HicB family antitoxin [Synergistaceae bacterium]MBR0256259.1 type II toxin-antitoxin system HicB family antitoxin [Synergistaceae bacterium]